MKTILLPYSYQLKIRQRRHAELLDQVAVVEITTRWSYLDPRQRYLYPAAHVADPSTTPEEGPSSRLPMTPYRTPALSSGAMRLLQI